MNWVISDGGFYSTIEKAVNSFASRLIEFRDQIAKAEPISGIAVYNPSATYACRILCDQINSFGAI